MIPVELFFCSHKSVTSMCSDIKIDIVNPYDKPSYEFLDDTGTVEPDIYDVWGPRCVSLFENWCRYKLRVYHKK